MKPKHRKITETFVPSVEQDGKVGPNLSEHIANGSSQITIEYLTSVIEDLKKQLETQKKEYEKDIKDLEKTTEEGYAQAYEMISALQQRLETQQEEYEKDFKDAIKFLKLEDKDGH